MVYHETKDFLKSAALYCLAMCLLVASMAGIAAKKPSRMYETTPAMKEELEQIKESVPGSTKGVFFIDIFDGLMPVPDRYKILINRETRYPLRFFSPVQLDESLKSSPGTYGEISIGSYKKYLKRNKADEKVAGKSLLKKTKMFKYGLHILTFALTKDIKDVGKAGQIIGVVIHNGKTYISIEDQNKLLWRAMLKTFSETPGR